MNALVMYDRETNSFWSQFLGEAVDGKLAGTKLPLVASQLIAWGHWKEQHPDTLFMDTGATGMVLDSYMPYYFSGEAGILGETHPDDRLNAKDLVVGVLGETSQKAYSLRSLAATSVVNDSLDGRKLVVVMDTERFATAVFDSNVSNQALTFDPSIDTGKMTDRETGSTWSKITGEAIAGDLKGERLGRYLYITAFWFGWTDFHPQTELYEPETGP